MNHFYIGEFKRHLTNLVGGFATVTSAEVAGSQPGWRGNMLFAISLIVGILTATHLFLQIRNLAISIAAEKTKDRKDAEEMLEDL